MLLASFPPIAAPHATTLILGSMPGGKSLQMNQYYAHPQNLFWSFMDELLDIPLQDSYATRTQKLADASFALWDVLQNCIRPGSLDSNIESSSMIVNDFITFFTEYPNIERVFFNGRKAQQVYDRLVLHTIIEHFPEIQYQWLPSTSPANASISKQEKLEQWKVIRKDSET